LDDPRARAALRAGGATGGSGRCGAWQGPGKEGVPGLPGGDALQLVLASLRSAPPE